MEKLEMYAYFAAEQSERNPFFFVREQEEE